MSVTTESPQPTFRIDMLWNDSRYRSSFLQVIALFAFFTVLYLLVRNVQGNLAVLGKEFGFEFMTTPSSYDINQQPIDYTSRDSHSRAAVVGILNTLLVALLGCFLATVIGVLAGVARLSKNWIIAKLMTVYVEVVRNIPVLIQILLFSAIITEVLPAPRAFRGDEPEASMWFFDSVAATNRGVYIPRPIWESGSAFVAAAFVIGVIASVWLGRYATRRQQQTGEIMAVLPIQAGLIIGLPVVVYLIMGMPIALDYPALQGFNFQGGLHLRESYVSLTLALAIYHGVFIAENVRAGIQAISKGQTEAAYALGLQPGRTMSLVVLPQALRVIIPPLISHYLNLTKNSSLALLVGYMDATGTLGGITLNQTGREFETLALLMAFYLSVSLSIAAVMNLYNQNAQLVERTSGTGMGFSFLSLVDAYTGKWELLKKGDAKMHDEYGIRGFLNLYVVFYAAVLLLLVNYVFIEHAVLVDHYATVLVELKTRANIEVAIADGLAMAAGQVLNDADKGAEYAAGVLLRLDWGDLQTVMQHYLATVDAADVTSINALAAAGAVEDQVYVRYSYYDWPTAIQLVSLGQIIFAFGALITCLFMNGRFIDLCVLELIVFLIAVLFGFPFSLLSDDLSGQVIIAGGLACRLAILGYTMFGARPNMTFFHRMRRA